MDRTIDLAAVALEYGPFLFAILFVTYLTMLAQRAYAKADDAEERKTFRTYFFVSFFFGLALVSVCVTWWIYDRVKPQRYVYTVDIQDVPNQVRFIPTDACISQRPVDSQLSFQMVRAVFVEDRRLQPGQKLRLDELLQTSGLGKPPAPVQHLLSISQPYITIDYSDLEKMVSRPDSRIAGGD